MSKHSVDGGDVPALLARFSQLQAKVKSRTGNQFPIVTIQEAGLDGFWIDRVLKANGIESYVVDPASIATSRRRRRAKTDRLDGEALLRALLAFKRGEPRVCAMVKAPSPEEEDRRRVCRERKVLIAERVKHVNRLLFSQGISGYEPLRKNRRTRLNELQTGDGRPLPTHIKSQIGRELDRLELLLAQITAVEKERDNLLAVQMHSPITLANTEAAMLCNIKGIGSEFAAVLWTEGLFRHFDNRRQVAAYAGWHRRPGKAERLTASKACLSQVIRDCEPQWSNCLGCSCVINQNALSTWFAAKVQFNGGRLKKCAIVALARKLLITLWKYVNSGVVIDGAIIKAA